MVVSDCRRGLKHVLLCCCLLGVVKGQGRLNLTFCEIQRLERCSQTIKDSELDFQSLVVSKEAIQKTCGPVLEAFLCLTNYYENCDVKNINMTEYFGEGEEIIVETCDMFQMRYEPHLPCYTTLEDTYDRCLANIGNVSIDVGRMGEATLEDQKILCCHIQKTMSCVTIPTLGECGPEASYVLQYLLSKQLPPFIEPLCQAIPEPVSCDQEMALLIPQQKPSGGESNEISSSNLATNYLLLTITSSAWSIRRFI